MGVTTLWVSAFSRFGAGVEKKLEAVRFCAGAPLGAALAAAEAVLPFGVGCEVGGEDLSTMKVVQPESMWLLISEDLTGLLQMGQSTAAMASSRNGRELQDAGEWT